MATATATDTGFRFDISGWIKCAVVAIIGAVVTVWLMPQLATFLAGAAPFFTAVVTAIWVFVIYTQTKMPWAATLTGALMGVAASVVTAVLGGTFIAGEAALAAITGGLVGFAADLQYRRYGNVLSWRMFFWTAVTAAFFLALWGLIYGLLNNAGFALGGTVTAFFGRLLERIGATMVSYFVLKFLFRSTFPDDK